MVCHEVKRRLGVAVGLAAFLVAGCSEAPAPPNAVAQAPRPAEPAPPQQEPKPAEPASPPPEPKPANPYDGLTVAEKALYQRIGELLEPVARGAIDAHAEFAETELRARAAAQLGAFNITLHPEAEKRLRKAVLDVKKADEAVQAYARTWAEVGPVESGSVFGDKAGPKSRAIAVLRAAYEEAFDAGEAFPPEIRRSLAELVRSPGLPYPSFYVNIDELTELMRTNLLEQTVTADDLFLMAHAVKERGEDVIKRRTVTRSIYDLVNALPPERRTQAITAIAWGKEREAEYKARREALFGNDFPSFLVVTNEGAAKVRKILEPLAEERRRAFISLEEGRRRDIEDYFRKVDEPGWRALVALNGLFGEFQSILDATAPDVGYRFRPLISPDASRGLEENVLPRLCLTDRSSGQQP